MKNNRRGFTVLELIVVCVIIGILAVLGLASFNGPKEQALDREAQANLKLIASAEKIYRMEMGQYIACANTGDINNKTRLLLSASNTDWKYMVSVAGVNNSTFLAKAQRMRGSNKDKLWCINETNQDNATTSGCGATF